MAATLTMTPSEAGPSSFPSNLDFIAFDAIEEEEGPIVGGLNHESEEETGSHKASASRSETRIISPKANGKKRKYDDELQFFEKIQNEKKKEVTKGTPWCVDVEFDRCITAADVLHDELAAFADWISPTRIEHETRNMVIELIGKAIKSQWPDADVRAFGSQNTQLYMPQGDIDLVVVSRKMEDQRREGVLRSMAACLRRNNLATDVQVIAKAKVPIIKFVCTYGKYKVDISVNQTNGLDASKLVSDWLHRCPALRPIIMATKLLLSQRGMSEVFSGGLGSYSVICMAISHMQMHPKIQRGEIDPSRNLGVLLLEFLELYGKNFGYDEVGISIVGRGSYFRKAGRGWKDDRRPFMLSIEDPGDATNDISKGSFSILNVRQTFGGAFDILTSVMCSRRRDQKEEKKKKKKYLDEDEEARDALVNGARADESSDKDPESLLGHIIGVNKEMMKTRRDIQALWENGTLQHKVGKAAPPRDPLPHSLPYKRPSDDAEIPKVSKVLWRNGNEAIPKGPKAMRENGNSKEKAKEVVSKNTVSLSKKEKKELQKKKEKKERKAERKKAKKANSTDGLQSASTSRGSSVGVKGSADDPVIVFDDSNDTPMQKQAAARKHLPIDLSPSPVSDMHRETSQDDAEERDNRYAQHRNGNGINSRLDQFSKSAPKTYVIDDSASEDGNMSGDDGEIKSKKKRKMSPAQNSEEEEAKRQRKRDYWESKGNALGQDERDNDEQFSH